MNFGNNEREYYMDDGANWNTSLGIVEGVRLLTTPKGCFLMFLYTIWAPPLEYNHTLIQFFLWFLFVYNFIYIKIITINVFSI